MLVCFKDGKEVYQMNIKSRNKVGVVVAGPRDYNNKGFVFGYLDGLLPMIKAETNRDVQIIEGGAKGVDFLAKQYAKAHNLSTIQVTADWARYGKSAGPRRNARMADLCGCCVVFYSGSAGSKSMITEAVKRGVPTYVVSISEKVGIGELFKVDNCREWERVKKMF